MNGLIILTVVAIVGSGEARGIVTGKPPTFHPVLSGFFVGLFLYVFAIINTDLAAKLCYLVMAGAVVANGAATITALNTTATPQKSVIPHTTPRKKKVLT